MSVTDLTYPTRAQGVTLYEDRAEVTRVATVPATPGTHWVRLEGLTPLVDDRSLRVVIASGEGTVHATRVERSVPEVPASLGEAVRLATQSLDIAQRALSREENDLRQLSLLDQAWSAALQASPADLVREEVAAGWSSAHDALGASARLGLVRQAEARSGIHQKIEAMAKAQHELADAQGRRETVATLAVQLEAKGGDVTLEVRYRTPCASWRPEHLARLNTDDPGAAKLELTTFACAWQATQEDDWDGVQLTFSTARPGLAASAPDLPEDSLYMRTRQDKTITVEARDEQIQHATLGGSKRAVSDMPGVDDGGQPLEWTAPSSLRFPANGQPLRVEIERRELDAQVELVAVSELAPAPHLRADATLSGGTPLLAGPVRLARQQSVVGRGRVAFVGVGEGFTLGFGAEQAVSVRRKLERESKTVPVIGTQKLTQTVTVYLSNLGEAPQTLEVRERVAVSELEQVSVEVKAPGWTQDEDGFLTRPLTLGPRGHETLTYTVQLSASS